MNINNYFENYFKILSEKISNVDKNQLATAATLIQDASEKVGTTYILGNGGSASIASHASVDFTKYAGINALTFSDYSLLTCFANDFGYERAFEKAIEFYAKPSDLLILISSSGESQNIINAALKARKIGLSIITFSGFSSNNRLRALGDENFWVDSNIYNFVENAHQVWLLSLVDFLKKTEI